MNLPLSSRKRKPKVLAVYPSLPRNEAYPLQEFKISVIQYANSDILCDVREFVTSVLGTGFTKKGLSLTYEQVKYLQVLLPSVLKTMEDAKALKEQSDVKP